MGFVRPFIQSTKPLFYAQTEWRITPGNFGPAALESVVQGIGSWEFRSTNLRMGLRVHIQEIGIMG